MRVWIFLGLAIAAFSIAGYRLLTATARQPVEDEAVTPEMAPRLVPVTKVRATNDENESDDSEDQPVLAQQLASDRLLDLAVHSPSAWTRADALEELATRKGNEAVPAVLAVFVDGLADADGDVRRVAADGLAELGDQIAVSALEHALATESVERTRLAMTQAMAELRQDQDQDQDNVP